MNISKDKSTLCCIHKINICIFIKITPEENFLNYNDGLFRLDNTLSQLKFVYYMYVNTPTVSTLHIYF